ncbi:MAG: DUF1320 domain-containing protein [Bacteroidales bacterium]
MRYITLDQLYTYMRKSQLTTLTDSQTSEPDMIVLEAVNAVCVAEIDGYLRGIYQLPLLPAPELITLIVADLMRYRLNQRRDAANMPEEAFRSYKATIDKLRDIQSRKIILDAPSTTGKESVTEGTISSITPSQGFGTHFTKLFNE